jgi:hypothetical protein
MKKIPTAAGRDVSGPKAQARSVRIAPRPRGAPGRSGPQAVHSGGGTDTLFIARRTGNLAANTRTEAAAVGKEACRKPGGLRPGKFVTGRRRP